MRVDLTTGALPEPESRKTSRAAPSGSASSSVTAPSTPEASADQTQFSFSPARVASLTAQALAAPEIRQAKVASLGEAVANGSYTVDAGQVAEAITSAYGGTSFR